MDSSDPRGPRDSFRYDAFISYSRRNSEAAERIERDLQNFPLPGPLRRRFGRRRLDIFRDVNDLTGNRLGPALEDNLRQSRALVVLCSPDARRSAYVGTEIDTFAALRGAQNIVPVLVGGVPNNEAGSEPTGWAFPDALNKALGDTPLAVDLRADRLTESRKAKRSAGSPWVQLVAGIVGVTPDDLTERIARAHRRRLQLSLAIVSVVLAVVLVLAGVAWHERTKAVQQALIATARQLSATAQMTARTDLQSALLLADTAFRTHEEPRTVEALHAVLAATPQLRRFYDFGEPLTSADGTPDGSVIAGGAESGRVKLIDHATGAVNEVLRLDGPIDFLAISDDGRTVAASSTRHDENWVWTSQSAIWRDGSVTMVPDRPLRALSPSGRTVAIQVDDALQLLSDGREVSRVPTGPVDAAELPDDTTVLAISREHVTRAAVDGSRIDSGDIAMSMTRGGQTISPGATRYAYSSGYKQIEVFDLAGPLGDGAVAARWAGQTGDSNITALALSPNGNRLATAADGSIFLSQVHAADALPGQYTELQGAGPVPRSLRFLSDELLLSAAGDSAAVWDLARNYPLATSAVPTELPWGCGICEPRTFVSPDGGKALIVNTGGHSVVDLSAGTSQTSKSAGTEADQVFVGTDSATQLAVVWLDPHRVFAYATARGQGWILTGDRLDVIERTLTLPRTDGAIIRTSLRADGTVAVLSEQALVLADPGTGSAEVTTLRADAITTDGTYVLDVVGPSSPEGQTAADIIDVATRKPVRTIHVDGGLASFIEHTGGGVTLLRAGSDTEVLTVNPHDDSSVAVGPRLPLAVSADKPFRGASAGDALFVKETRAINRYSLHDGSRIGLFPIETEFQAYNSMGPASDGAYLVVASQPLDRVFRIPTSSREWSVMACEAAGRKLEPGELGAVVGSTDGLKPGCETAPA